MRSVTPITMIGAAVTNAANAENNFCLSAAGRIGTTEQPSILLLGIVLPHHNGLGLRFLRGIVVVHAGIVADDPRSVKPCAGDHYVLRHTDPD